MTKTHTLAFEIGTEEIPAFDLDSATQQLAKMAPAAFDAARIPYERVEIFSSPRRLIVMAYGMAEATEALVEDHKGPNVKIAFDAQGNPTKAAEGFARGKGLTVDDLERRVVDGVEYIFAVKNVPATPVADLLPEILTRFITDLKWPRSCRWGKQTQYFTRPVRWLVALLGETTIPVQFAAVSSDTFTMGHRVLAPGKHTVANADELLSVVKAAGVVPSQAAREDIIRAGVAAIEKETGAVAQLPAKTLLEVVNLSEFPTPMKATFDVEFLQVPEEIIVDAMLMHQRYFPLYKDGKLTNDFIIVSNGNPECAATIIDGNERVVRARLDDAKFFYEEDLKKPLETYVDRLDEVIFQEKLGTVLDKTKRLVSLAGHLAEDAALDEQDAADLKRAAYLCKADLITNAVVEFTSVQGVMGSYYAAACGETEQVATAIGQHYQPRFSGDAAPDSTVGKLVAFADKLDTICGLFAVDQGPSGSSDPFALRRSAIGIVNMLSDGLPVELHGAVRSALDALSTVEFDRTAVEDQIMDFFITRTKVMLRDEGCSADAVDAVLAGGVVEPAEIVARTHALETARAESPEVMADLATAYARANNLRDDAAGTQVKEEMLDEVRHALVCAINQAQRDVSRALDAGHYAEALQALAALRKPIDLFFERIKVMDDDEAIRANNMALLNSFVAVFAHVADFGKLAK